MNDTQFYDFESKFMSSSHTSYLPFIPAHCNSTTVMYVFTTMQLHQ